MQNTANISLLVGLRDIALIRFSGDQNSLRITKATVKL